MRFDGGNGPGKTVADDDDIDIFVESSVVPLPAGASLGLAGLAVLGGVRRRRVTA